MKSFRYFIGEMAKNLNPGNVDIDVPLDNLNTRREYYKISSNMKHYSSPSFNKDLEVVKHHSIENGEPLIEYHTNNNKTKETIHRSAIITHNPTKRLPFKHDEQVETFRQKDGELPKGYGVDFTYNHFKNNEHPLRSSRDQLIGGNKMWHKLAHKALDDGHYVYFHDGENLHKTTKENIDNHLKSYFGDSDDYTNKHIILSKTELGK